MTSQLKLILVFCLGLSSSLAFGQCDSNYNWPEDGQLKAKAESNLVYFQDALKEGRYKQALPAVNWLLVNTPTLSKDVYIQAASLYDNLADQEKDPTKKTQYVDSLLLMYDLRLQNTPCNDEAEIANRKAYSAYKQEINSSDPKRAANVLDLMDKAFDLNKSNILEFTLVPFMNTILINHLKFNKLTEDEIMQRYDMLSTIIDEKSKTATGATLARLQSDKAQIDDILLKLVNIDCAFINKNLIPKYKTNPSDSLLAQKIFQFMLKANCTDDPMWLQIGESIFETKKDFGLAKNLAVKLIANGKYDEAEKYLKAAVDLAPQPADKCDVFIMLGGIHSKNGDKPGARDYYRQCIAANPSGASDAYERIGDLYYSSFDDCAQKQSMAEDRLVFIAAYDMYMKAGDNQKAAQAKAQFPSVEDIFTQGWNEGDSKHVGCWINTDVILHTRPKDQ